MIIGVSGKIGSGKDLIGKIIQYLDYEKWYKENDFEQVSLLSFQEYIKQSELHYSQTTKWQIKKFADKLKDIVCLLIGCNREELEDSEFKNTELGEEWWIYHCIDTEGEEVIKSYVNNNEKDLEDYIHVDLIKVTPRYLLQNIGTNLFRNLLNENIWVNSLFVDYNCKHVKGGNFEKPKWVITDLRFPNELKAIKDRGGITIRVNRDRYFRTGDLRNDLQLKEHESEIALDNYQEFDYVVDNSGTIEDLITNVKIILKLENII